ncbi:MAG: GNAT family N-acetyltransferase [Synergistaceae bacterium]|nr:GNAT family N-acetyltransferase [Synergistaceae bacterium]
MISFEEKEVEMTSIGRQIEIDCYNEDEERPHIATLKFLEEQNYVASIEVFEEFRNKGYGTEILKAFAQKYGKIYLCPTNEDNERLFARLGKETENFPETLLEFYVEHEKMFVIERIEEDNPKTLTVSFPLEMHTVKSLLNLIYMVYTRGALLSKATHGNFRIDKELIDVLSEDENFESKEDLIEFIQGQIEDGKRFEGLSFNNNLIIFDGFTDIENPEDEMGVFSRLALQMNKAAIHQKKIHAKEITEPNEKYIFRIWLSRLGMNGDEFKDDRKILMKHLTGNSAFRTEADKAKWMEKYGRAKKEN